MHGKPWNGCSKIEARTFVCEGFISSGGCVAGAGFFASGPAGEDGVGLRGTAASLFLACDLGGDAAEAALGFRAAADGRRQGATATRFNAVISRKQRSTS